MNRAQAWSILSEYTKNPALIRHALTVEAAMRYYARHYGQDEERWGVVGLLHDFDYERWPDPADHTKEGARILREAGCDEEIVLAMLSHVPWNTDQYPRDTPLRQALFAVDELCGFLHAAALVRPQRLEGMTASSIKKKMKQKAFAAAVSREDIVAGAELLGIPLEEHIDNCIRALLPIAKELGLEPQPEAAPE
ncbi:MAG TPA: HDIG domain-containing protein [Phycisphaerae bacterium]|nr:HDIG domain-containing protein [Phycisphaerae bacterium]HNU44010.1 HDIG domain-containing protein [Phycisphaerae bacterium]